MKMILGLAALVATGALASVQLGSADGASGGSAGAPEAAASGAAQDEAGQGRKPDVIYVPTPQPVVDEMLRLARLEKGDVLYDLGSGDGRIPITAAKTYGVRAVGIDIDPQRIAEANANARAAGVTELVTFRQADLFETDLREADVVTLYLLQTLNEKLRPKLLAELDPGSRIVSHAFDMGDWEPERREEVDGSKIFLWTVPKR
ncbi:MAG: SAM-dependent methyltransferase [Allosphingosinicella sp.]